MTHREYIHKNMTAGEHKAYIRMWTRKYEEIRTSTCRKAEQEKYLRMIEMHTEEYIIKTGELPTW